MNTTVKSILALNIGLLMLMFAVVAVSQVHGKEYGAIIIFPLEQEPVEPYIPGSFAKWMNNQSEPRPAILGPDPCSYKYNLCD